MLSSSFKAALKLRAPVANLSYKKAFPVRSLRTATTSMAQSDTIKFYNIFPEPGSCPFAQRAWVTLEEKGLKYEKILIDPANKPVEFQELYRSITLDPEATGKVPVVIDGGDKVTESLVVVEYLDAKYPGQGTKILPSDPNNLQKAKLFVELFGEKYGSLVFKILGSKTQADVDVAVENLKKGLKVLDSFLVKRGSTDGGNYLLGSEYSLAEVAAVGQLQRSLVALPKLRGFDPLAYAKEAGLGRLADWVQAVVDRPSSKTTYPGTPEQIVASYKRFTPDLSG